MDTDDDAKVYIGPPNPAWRNIEDCGVDQVI
jgi:hypothetical protein